MIPKRIPNGHWHMHIAQGDAVEHRNGLVVAGPTVVPPTRDIPGAAQFPSPASWRFAAPFNVHALTLRAGAGSAIRSPTDRPTDCGASIRTSPVRMGLGAVWSPRRPPAFRIPEDVPAIATITERGTSNFVVTSLAADGSQNELPVNVIGSYSGTRLFDTDAGQHSVAFKVESNGFWAIVIKPIALASAWNPAKALNGRGDNVVRLAPPTSGLTTVTMTHRGSENFVVMAFTADGADLLIHEIGNYSGQVPTAPCS
jgi:hypothetical protein